MSAVAKKRHEIKRLKKRRENLAAVIAEKVEERRRLSAERRDLIANRQDKKNRDPQTDDRIERLAKEIAHLHDQIMRHGDEILLRTQQLDDRRKRRSAVTKRLKQAQRELKKLLTPHGPDAAVKAAARDIGKTEVPYGSNWGPYVSKVIKFTGYTGPVYWCGCAVCWWVVKKAAAVVPTRIRLGYAGYIGADARANTNGLRAVSSPQKGAIGTLWNYEHIVLITGPAVNGMVPTIEGNTSATDGSQSNGGGVFRKSRPIGDFDVFAIPNY